MSVIKQIIFLVFLLIGVMLGCVYTYFTQYEIEMNTPTLIVSQEEITNPSPSEQKINEEITENKEVVDNEEEKVNEEIDKKVEELKEIEKPEIVDENNIIVEEKQVEEKPKEVKELSQEKKIEELSKMIQPKKILNAKTQEEIDKVLSKEKIFFKRLGTDVTDESYKVIEEIAKILLKNENVKIEIGGHTDAKGETEVNKWISLERAKSVKKELEKLGISKDRITAVGYGESKPLVPNDKNGYSFENRRVEFKIIEE
ncbi:OmpA family protein [Arcobacter sp.]|uniref:OmpA family protein n=1 Tax=Arcobacter sp. TaxID=1872629 RepID=UPI003D0AC4B8